MSENDEVIMDRQLAFLVKQWRNHAAIVDRRWTHIVQYVIEKGCPKETVIKALTLNGELNPLTVRNEANVIMKLASHPEYLQDCVDGKITVRELRSIVVSGPRKK